MSRSDASKMGEWSNLGAEIKLSQPVRWKCVTQIDKEWKADDPVSGMFRGDTETIVVAGNTLVNGGASVIWERLITLKPSTSSTGAALQGFSTGTSRIGVGNSTAATTVTMTDLQGASKTYKSMEAGFPSHSDGTSSSGARQIQLKASFSTAQANYAWQEWATFNSTAATKRMLQRKQQNVGTKTSAATWTITVTLSLS